MDAQLSVKFYEQTLRIRLFEEKVAELYPQQEMRCPVHLSIGQEAVAVGVCSALQPSDGVYSNHRSHGHYLAKGGDMRAMLAEFYGKATGCARGKGGSMHLIDLQAGFLGAVPIVGNTIPLAVGAAFAVRLQKQDRVIVAFFGEGATEEGVFHESMNFAALHNLPVIFVCENNLYSVYSGLHVRQPETRDNLLLARGYGVPSFRGDGSNVFEVYELSLNAVERARAGSGPVYLEFATYRWREHCGPNFDNDLGYRPASEYGLHQRRCPIAGLEAHLLAEKILTSGEVAEIRKRIEAEIAAAVDFAKKSPFPPEHEARRHVFA